VEVGTLGRLVAAVDSVASALFGLAALLLLSVGLALAALLLLPRRHLRLLQII
jgi:hypothetical protein